MSRGLPRGTPGPRRGSRGGAEFACRTPSAVRQVPWGRRGRGRGEKGVEMGFPPLGRALVEEAPGQPRAACFRLRSRDPAARTGSAEPRSARRTGPSVPGGQRLWLLGFWGSTPHRACPSPPGRTREHPSPQQLSAVVKYTPRSPSSACPLPEAAEKHRRERETSGKSRTVAVAAPGPPLPRLPVRTPTRI